MTGKEVLHAIADGADPSEFECRYKLDAWKQFVPDDWAVSCVMDSQYHTFRRKPRTRVVNGFTVPAPIQDMPKKDQMLYVADPMHQDFFIEALVRGCWESGLTRGLLFSTKEAAIANAKAMCGINPEAE